MDRTPQATPESSPFSAIRARWYALSTWEKIAAGAATPFLILVLPLVGIVYVWFVGLPLAARVLWGD